MRVLKAHSKCGAAANASPRLLSPVPSKPITPGHKSSSASARGLVACAGLIMPEHLDAASSANDVAGPVADLIIKAAHMDGTQAAGLINSLLQGLNDAGTHHAVADAGLVHSAMDSVAAAAVPHLQAAAPSLPEMAMAATSAMASDHAVSSSLQGLAMWAADRLSVVQTIDPASYDIMHNSLTELLEGLRGVLDQHSAEHTTSWTNALVLGVQQLVTTLHAPGTAGTSVEAIVAAQEAMQVTLAGTAADMAGVARAAGIVGRGAAVGELPSGLGGLLQIVLALMAMVVAAIPRDDWRQRAAAAVNASAAGGAESAASNDPRDQVPTRYNVPELQAYFSKRPSLVLKRQADVLSKLSSFTVSILADWKLGLWDANMPERAKWIRGVCEELGPAYIKIAQMLSTRVDVIPKPYIQQLSHLQDKVGVFSTVEARCVLEEGLNRPVDSVFEWLSEEPIAAASLGQVYRGKLRPEWGGMEVAVKVQRPGALERAALDIFVMRRAAVLFSKLPGMSDKWALALDDWASRFFQEMDYQLEAYNTMTFKKHMAGLENVRVATVFPELTSRKVIVTEWIEGERLGNSKSEDVLALCSTILNCYLIQLLETGLLHADPHPGNLMRTPDGKVVILDFGLMTEVTEDQRIALVEYISHLMVEDWEGVAADLVKLGFFPEGTVLPPEAIKHIAPVMEQIMGQLVRGGGLGSFNITGVTMELQGVATKYQLAIPPYFALVLRAFSVIEGIALKVDPDYAIVTECLPYMSRRLLTDNNPRMRAALRQLLYGDSQRLDLDRLQRMISAFAKYSSAGNAEPLASGPTFSAAAGGNAFFGGAGAKDAAAANGGKPLRLSQRSAAGAAAEGTLIAGLLTGGNGGEDGPILNDSMKEVLKLVFSKEGSYAQEIIVDEAVAAIDAMSREAMGETLRLVASSATTVATLRSVEALGPLRAMLLPLPLPMDMISHMQPAVALSSEDRQALSTIRTLLDLLAPPPGAPGPNVAGMGVRAVRTMGEVAPMLPELLPGVQVTLELFFRQLIRRMALRLAEDLDTAGKAAASSRAANAKSYYSPGLQMGSSQQQPPQGYYPPQAGYPPQQYPPQSYPPPPPGSAPYSSYSSVRPPTPPYGSSHYHPPGHH